MLILNKKDLEFDKAKSREWLITNGIGGFSSSTIIGLNTKKQHGLLFSSLKPHLNRYLFLSRVEESLLVKDKLKELSTSEFPGIVHHGGFNFQDGFVFNAFPTFHYNVDGVRISKSIMMPEGHNAVIISYFINSPISFSFRVKPLVNFRSLNSVTRNNKTPLKQIPSTNTVVLKPNDKDVMIIGSDKGRYVKNSYWSYNNYYGYDKDNGTDYLEDNFIPGEFVFDIKKGVSRFNIICVGDESKSAYISFNSIYSNDPNELKKRFDSEIIKYYDMVKNSYNVSHIKNDILFRYLVSSSYQFIVNDASSSFMVSGYPYYGDNSRYALISIPGICLSIGRLQDAKDIITNLANHCNDGLIPVHISENDTPDYRSVDTSLWFFYSVYKYYEYSKDIDFIKGKIFNTMKDIINNYENGTNFGISMDKDFLIDADYKHPLTWMSSHNSIRQGKCVEVNALWYNALMIFDFFRKELKVRDTHYSYLAKKCKESFNKKFWNSSSKCLYDIVNKNSKDISVRPNQLIALFLPFSLLDKNKEIRVLEKVSNELLTPFGLRSLSSNDNNYIKNPNSNKEYFNGAVHGWLIGPYISSYLKLHNYSAKAKQECKNKILHYIENSLKEHGVGNVSEIYDGDYPFSPKGCISFSASVGELLRVYVEDLNKK